jgi:phage tail-like protein
MADNRVDPLGVFNFYLTLIDSSDAAGSLVSGAANYAVAGFSECSGIDATVEMMEYKEGGVNDYVHKFPTRASFSNIVLKHGVLAVDNDLWDWHNDFVQGRGTRRDGLIVLQDDARVPTKIWRFKRGIPTKWIGPSLNATQSNVAVESLEIAHEGLEMETT